MTDTDTDRTDQSGPTDDVTEESTASTTPVSDGAGATSTNPEETVGTDSSTASSASDRLVSIVQWAAFAILCLLALVATFQFYFNVSDAIRVWFSPDFRPIFQALFNLVVLIASATGISLLVRRLR